MGNPPSLRPRHPFGAILIFAAGILLAGALVTMLTASLWYPLGCIDPRRCVQLADTSYLERWTAALRAPSELREEAFRGLASVALGLTALGVFVVGVNLGTRLGAVALLRRGVFAVRAVLGATPRHLLRPLTVEAGRILLCGAIVGAAAAAGAAWLLRRSWPLGPAPWANASGSGLLLALGISGLLAVPILLITLSPAALGWRRDLRRHLATGDRATAPPTEGLVREGLAVLQVASSLVLVVTSGLLLAAFLPEGDGAGESHHPRLVSAELRPNAATTSGAPSQPLVTSLLERVRAVPGVTDTSLTTEGAPLGQGVEDRVAVICPECRIGSLPKQQTSAAARIHGVTPGSFAMLGLEVIRGRDLAEHDTAGAARVAVVSNAFAVRFFPGGDPVGQEVRLGELPGLWFTVVGVVEDRPGAGLGSATRRQPVLYLSMAQLSPAPLRVLVRIDPGEDVTGVLAEASAAIAQVMPLATLGPWTPIRRLIARERAPLAWFGGLLAVLALFVTGLATNGLYQVMTHTVAMRRREIGVRMAIGADEGVVLRLVIGRSCRLVAVGVVVGMIPLVGLARLLQLRYEGVEPWNPFIAVTVAGLLLGIAILASHRAAREATRVDPAIAMRA